MLFLSILFIGLTLLTAFDFVNTKYKNVIFLLTGFCLFISAGLRPSTIDRDYVGYLRMFERGHFFENILLEPSFGVISFIVKKLFFSQAIFLFIIYAGIAMVTKFIAIKQLSGFWFLSLLMYFSYSFILHDMTQIRAGVSVGFILLSIKPLYEKRTSRFLFFALMAFFFHYSAIVFFLLILFRTDTINVKIYMIVVIGCYFISTFSAAFISSFTEYLPEGALLSKVSRYENDNGNALNIFNSWQILRCILCYVFLLNINLLKQYNQYSIILVKMYILSTVLYVLFASNPTFATRISDLFSIVDIVLIPCIVNIIYPKLAGIITVVLISFFYLALNLYFNKIIT